jgi:ABC-type glycerol-3-phosphate transport system substrate-binding protein
MQGKNFQIITLAVFIFAAVIGVLVFSGAIPIGSDKSAGGQGTVVLWGTIKTQDIAPLLENFNLANPSFVVKYVQKSSDTFDKDLLEALASGVGPDMFFLPDDLVYHYKNKILPIPYQSFPLATFKNNFAGAGEVFLTSQGVLAFPITIDPLVMYYNRSMLDANGITNPPVYWDDLVNMVPLLTKKDANNTVTKSAVAMGQFVNISHAKDIIAALFMQAGNPIISEKEGVFVSLLGQTVGKYDLASVLQFYADFADPLKNVYSWNRSFSNSSDAFSAENLAFYFGHSSELKNLVEKNPNQNFLVAPIPQIKNANFKLTSGRVNGIAISAFSKNLTTAITAAGLMSSGEFAGQLATTLNVAPARRDLLAIKQVDAYNTTFYPSALYARSWLDPSSEDTDVIFKGMIDGVLSNNLSADNAVRDASSKLDLLLLK